MRHLARDMRKHRLALGLFALLFLLFASNVPLAPPRAEAAAAPRRTLGLLYTYYTDSTKEFGCGSYNSCTHVQVGCHTVYNDREPIICGE
jgi:hypothetical protein